MKKQQVMRPQDVVILCKILTFQHQTDWNFARIAQELGMSASEVTESLRRSQFARLIDSSKRQVARKSLLEFLVYGLRYVFPAEPAKIVRGMPTAHSAPLLAQYFSQSQDVYVWEDEEGIVRGQAIQPLYSTVPDVCRKSESLYEMLTLIDAIRVGKAREREISIELLTIKINE